MMAPQGACEEARAALGAPGASPWQCGGICPAGVPGHGRCCWLRKHQQLSVSCAAVPVGRLHMPSRRRGSCCAGAARMQSLREPLMSCSTGISCAWPACQQGRRGMHTGDSLCGRPNSTRCLRRPTCWQPPSRAARPTAGWGPCRAARAARSASAWSRAPTAPSARPNSPRRAWVHAGASPRLDLVQRGMAAAPSRNHAAAARSHHARGAASAGAASGARGPVSGAPGLTRRRRFTWAVALTP